MNILFVCTGNTCRSALAHHVFQKMVADQGWKDIRISSCGTYGSAQLRVPAVVYELLEKEGISGVAHRSQPLTRESVEQADLILGMSQEHLDEIVERFPGVEGKAHLLRRFVGIEADPDIADPLGQPREVYESCLKTLKESLERLLEKVRERIA
ncbi:MAG: low molecular weight protein arginine phosphatase [Elusimicrobia bacterium]|nr:low molecular weight protein arginine phosphatase [Elusimicrobiota bacterium]